MLALVRSLSSNAGLGPRGVGSGSGVVAKDLQVWINAQRDLRKKGLLREDRLARLEHANFIWNSH
eukprot:2236920-Rhodomonas_salina.3